MGSAVDYCCFAIQVYAVPHAHATVARIPADSIFSRICLIASFVEMYNLALTFNFHREIGQEDHLGTMLCDCLCYTDEWLSDFDHDREINHVSSPI